MRIATYTVGFHDSNVCLYDSERDWFVYLKEERITGRKHAGSQRAFFRRMLSKFDFCPDEMAFEGGDGENLFLKRRANEWEVDHHYAHVLSAWPLTSSARYGVAVDGFGQNGLSTVVFANPFDLANCSFAFRGGRNTSFGRALRRIGEVMELGGQGIDLAGKIMGLQAYGKPDSGSPKSSESRAAYNSINQFDPAAIPRPASFENSDFRNWLAGYHQTWKLAMIDLFLDHIPTEAEVVLSGGAAQNTITNAAIAEKWRSLKIVPHCYDGGISLGLLAFLCLKNKLPLPTRGGFPYWQHDVENLIPSEAVIARASEALAAGKIVGWYQGNGELGPRALGNRSILMDPRIPDGKDILNRRVKRREHWRPFAPSVLADHAASWFELTDDKGSPFMLKALPVRAERMGMIPAVTHVDGTSRIQTVTAESNASFHRLLQHFHSISEVPVLLNTSLNQGGKPIAGSLEDGLATLNLTGMDMLVAGDKIYTK